MEIFPLQLHLHYRCQPNAVFFLPWENSRHSTTPTLVSPRNNVWETSGEIPYRWRTRHYPDLIGWKFASTSHIWVMTRHQYGISALVSETSFHGETSGDDANVGIFLRLWSPPILPFAEADRLLSKEHGSANKRDGFVTILVVGHSIQAISWFRKATSFPEFTLFPIMRKRFSKCASW